MYNFTPLKYVVTNLQNMFHIKWVKTFSSEVLPLDSCIKLIKLLNIIYINIIPLCHFQNSPFSYLLSELWKWHSGIWRSFLAFEWTMIHIWRSGVLNELNRVKVFLKAFLVIGRENIMKHISWIVNHHKGSLRCYRYIFMCSL